MKGKWARWAWLILLLCGIVCSLILLVGRISAERNDRAAAAAAFYEDVCLLAEESGLSRQEWLTLFSEQGVRYVIFKTWPEETVLQTMERLDMAPGSMGGGSGNWAFVIPLLDRSLGSGSGTLVALEYRDRSTIHLPEGLDLNGYEEPVIKAFYLHDDCIIRYTEQERGQEIENIFTRAIVDRGNRLLLVRPFYLGEGGPLITEQASYIEVLSGVKSRVEERGWTFGGKVSTLETKPFDPLLVCGSGMLTAALWIFLLTRPEKLRRFMGVLCIAAVVVLVAGCLIAPLLTQKGIMFLCVVAFPCMAIYGLRNFLQHIGTSRLPAVVEYLLGLAALMVWSLLGGLAVSALMADRCYLLGASIFTGVKVSEAVPLTVCVVLFGIPVLRWLRTKKLSWKHAIPLAAVVLICLVAGAVLIRRSGDFDEISQLEKNFRDGIEIFLYTRPRTKEMLVGIPLMSLLFIRQGQNNPAVKLAGGVGCVLECVSVTNTFCHGVAPMYVSLLRTLLGGAVGFVPGLVVLGLGTLIAVQYSK